MRSLLEKFQEKYSPGPNKDSCWEWFGAKGSTGYGNMHHEYKILAAHRVSYTLYKGNIPDGLCVCHECDNPGCVNPDHLFLGTLADNSADMTAKGRSRGREFTLEKKELARSFLKSGYEQQEIADRLNVTQQAISKLKVVENL